MMFRNLIVVTFLVAAARSNGETCSVCGDNWVVGAPDALVSFPGQFSISCEQLQVAGMSGLIPLHQCEMFRPLLLDVCSCQELMGDVIQEEGQDVKLRRMMGPKRRLEEWSPAMAPTDNSRSSPVDSAEGEIVTSEYPGDDERNDDEEYADDDSVHKKELEDKIADGSLFAPHGSTAPFVAAPVGVSPIMASSPVSPVLSPSN